MYYLWKLRDKYPNLTAKLLYVGVPYQNMIEFDVEFDMTVIDNLKRSGRIYGSALKTKLLQFFHLQYLVHLKVKLN